MMNNSSVIEYCDNNIYDSPDSPDIYSSPSTSLDGDDLVEDELAFTDDIYGSPCLNKFNNLSLIHEKMHAEDNLHNCKDMIAYEEDKLLLTSALDLMQQSIASMQVKINMKCDVEPMEKTKYSESPCKLYNENHENSEETDKNMINISISKKIMNSNSISICFSPGSRKKRIISNSNTSGSCKLSSSSLDKQEDFPTEATACYPVINLDRVKFQNNPDVKVYQSKLIKVIIIAFVILLVVVATSFIIIFRTKYSSENDKNKEKINPLPAIIKGLDTSNNISHYNLEILAINEGIKSSEETYYPLLDKKENMIDTITSLPTDSTTNTLTTPNTITSIPTDSTTISEQLLVVTIDETETALLLSYQYTNPNNVQVIKENHPSIQKHQHVLFSLPNPLQLMINLLKNLVGRIKFVVYSILFNRRKH